MNYQNIPGERLSKFHKIWEQKGAPPSVQQIIKTGHRIQFEKSPPLTLPLKQYETFLSPTQSLIVEQEIKELVEKGALRVVSYSEAIKVPGLYSRVFVVPKPNGNHRVIINMKPLNKFIVKETFHMESEKEVRSLLEPGCWGSVIDLSDAYYLVSVDKRDRKYCRFIFQGKIYEYKALPMGLTESPRVFTRIARFAAGLIRKKGIKLVMYMDNLLVIAQTKQTCQSSVDTTIDILSELGFLLNHAKCNLSPSTRFTYLGCIWDTQAWTVAVKPNREEKIRETATHILQQECVTYYKVAQFLGRVISTSGAIPLARGRSRALQWQLAAAGCHSKQDYEQVMKLSLASREELKFWAELQSGICSPITSATLPSETVFTDSTENGIGIYFHGDLISEKIDTEFMNFHINVKELLYSSYWK